MFRSQLTRSARSVVEPAGPAEPAGASARGARARCAYGAADSFRSAHILLLEVPEDADRPAQGRQRPSRTCTDWPPCRCHRDHLIVVSGLAIRPCLLDRPPMRSGDVRAMKDGWISRAHPRLIPVHERVDGGQARMAHPAAAHAQPGVPITGHRGGAGEKRRGGRAGDSRSPRERPRRSAMEPAPAGRPRSPPPPSQCCPICQTKVSR
jgi:hypothetical protein